MKTKTSKKLFFIIIAVVALATIGFLVYKKNNKNTPSAQTVVQDNKLDAQKDSTVMPATDAEKQEVEQVKTADPKPTTTNPANTSVEAQAQQETDKSLTVKTQLKGATWKKCVLKLSKANAVTITQESETLYQPDYSTCLGFSVPANSFAEAGTWNIELVAYTNQDVAVSYVGTVNISK